MTSTFSLFFLAFTITLTGAMAPGPLLTYTIMKTVRTEKRGYLTGLYVIMGHAVLEAAVILLLLAGFASLLRNETVLKVIGCTGGAVIIIFGVSIVYDAGRGKISFSADDEKKSKSSAVIRSPVLAGILVSMSNPYWWIWWATTGLAFMMNQSVSFASKPRLAVFFIAHEAGDLVWYLFVSVAVFLGMRRFKTNVYSVVLFACGVVMILFGLYLGLSRLI